MNRPITTAITLVCALSFGLDSASAQGKGGGKGKGNSSAAKGGGASKSKGPDKEKGGKERGPGKEKGPGKQKGGKEKGQGVDWNKHDHRSKDKERADILSYWDQYKGNDHGLPPGLAKNLRRGKPLPPGWEKKVGVGSIIDLELWGTFDRVPGTYLPRDMILPRGTGMFLYGDRMLRVRESDRTVLDSIRIPSIRL